MKISKFFKKSSKLLKAPSIFFKKIQENLQNHKKKSKKSFKKFQKFPKNLIKFKSMLLLWKLFAPRPLKTIASKLMIINLIVTNFETPQPTILSCFSQYVLRVEYYVYR